MSSLDCERVVLSGIGTDIMAACMDEIMRYLATRKQFGQQIGGSQLMQGKIADVYTKLNPACAHDYAVAAACRPGASDPRRCGGQPLPFVQDGVLVQLSDGRSR